jgi:hypothetical protein
MISLNLNESESKRLEELAATLSVDPQELARAAVNSLFARPAEDFQQAASYVLSKNKELYDRLS